MTPIPAEEVNDMPSLQSKLVIFMLKYRHLMRFTLKRTTIDENTSIPALREQIERDAGRWGKLPPGIHADPLEIDGMYAEWIVPEGGRHDQTILYFHGGGLVVGSARSHRAVVAKFVAGSGIPALVFDYGLAPERPFPEGLNDSLRAYRYLLEQGIEPWNIVFMGDSGGGNLCLALLLKLKERNMPLPAAAVALSPWTDLTNAGDSFRTNIRKDALSWKGAQDVFSRYYAGANDPATPLISPLFGDLRGLPPLLLYAGSDELMRDDSVRFAERARQAGVEVELHVGEGMFHCYPVCGSLFPEAATAMADICAFIRHHVSKASHAPGSAVASLKE